MWNFKNKLFGKNDTTAPQKKIPLPAAPVFWLHQFNVTICSETFVIFRVLQECVAYPVLGIWRPLRMWDPKLQIIYLIRESSFCQAYAWAEGWNYSTKKYT
jgi:hypothetical protein